MILTVKPVADMNHKELGDLLDRLKPSQMTDMLGYFAGSHPESFDRALRMADGLTAGVNRL